MKKSKYKIIFSLDGTFDGNILNVTEQNCDKLPCCSLEKIRLNKNIHLGKIHIEIHSFRKTCEASIFKITSFRIRSINSQGLLVKFSAWLNKKPIKITIHQFLGKFSG